jgi:histidine racemase
MTEDAVQGASSTDDQQLNIQKVSALNSLDGSMLAGMISVYRQAFAQDPYNEDCSDDEAEAKFAYILERMGDLLVGKLGDTVAAIAGGYVLNDDEYFIEELAVAPEHQGHGYGRTALKALLQEASTGRFSQFRVRTTGKNVKAIRLYQSEGFTSEAVTQVVSHRRKDGAFSVDERVYLSRPPYDISPSWATLRRMVVAYPSGNTTALVYDQLLSSDRKLLNDRIMRSWKSAHPDLPEIEQCCFLTLPFNSEAAVRVEMFGGEFCGNATRSAAWVVTEGNDYSGLIEVSGVDKPLKFTVQGGEVTVEMPLPEGNRRPRVVDEGTLVELDGISQLVVTDTSHREIKTARQTLSELLASNKYGLAGQPAVGVTYYDSSTGQAEFCVWVNEVATIFDETACGSGTCAVGVAAAARAGGAERLSVTQPSGEVIITDSEYDSDLAQVTGSSITGQVKILYDGEFEAK